MTPLHLAEADHPDWDALLASHAGFAVEQTRSWADVQATRGWTSARLAGTRDGELVGGIQCLIRNVRGLLKVGYVVRGPFRHRDRGDGLRAYTAALRSLARRHRLAYLAVVPAYFDEPERKPFEREGFFEGADPFPPRSPMTATLVVDLSPPLEGILAAMRATTRKHIRAGTRRGLVCRDGTAADLPGFARLLVALCERRGAKPNIPVGDFLNHLWDRFHPAGTLKLLVVEYGQEPVCAEILFRLGDWCRAWRIGWSGAHADKYPNELIYWESLRWAREQGCRHFDFFGFNTELARQILAGSPPTYEEAGRLCSMSNFKLGFGGTLLPPAPRYCYLPNRVAAWLARCAAPAALRSTFVRRWLSATPARANFPLPRTEGSGQSSGVKSAPPRPIPAAQAPAPEAPSRTHPVEAGTRTRRTSPD